VHLCLKAARLPTVLLWVMQIEMGKQRSVR
jgi:hypothetical protein